MNKITNSANSSKHLGCLGAHTTGEATHGAALAHQVLRGMSYDPERYEREAYDDTYTLIVGRMNHLLTDVGQLIGNLQGMHDRFGSVPQELLDRVDGLAAMLTDGGISVDPASQEALERLQSQGDDWDMRHHYGREPSDYRGEE